MANYSRSMTGWSVFNVLSTNGLLHLLVQEELGQVLSVIRTERKRRDLEVSTSSMYGSA